MFPTTLTQQYSWVAKSNSSGMATLTITIPFTYIYFIRVRAWNQETQGLVDINVNDQYFYDDCPVSGSGFRHVHTTTALTNYFTCKLTGDSYLFIEDDNSTPGKIRAQNDNFNPADSDFEWGLMSRVRDQFPTGMPIASALISSASSYEPTGTCDLYIKCLNSDVWNFNSELKSIDAIQSAPATSLYNCFAWSVGITSTSGDKSIHPLELWDEYCVEVYGPPPYYDIYCDTLPSLDNLYNTFGYTRDGANFNNSIIDVWYDENWLGGSYVHASITKPGNNHPHGYDWESKPGSHVRTFHPRSELNSYGVPALFYIADDKKSSGIISVH